MKYFELAPFEIRVTADTVVRALAADDKNLAEEQKNTEQALDQKESDR
jgi:hypothetical protein